MKKKYSTKPGRRSLGKGGSTLARHSLGEGGFFNLRALLGLTLCLSGVALAILAERGAAPRPGPEADRYMPVPGGSSQSESARLAELEQYWHDRLTFPTGRFDPAWVRAAAAQHARMTSGVPAGQHPKPDLAQPNLLRTTNFTATGAPPIRDTGCSRCFVYTKTAERAEAT